MGGQVLVQKGFPSGHFIFQVFRIQRQICCHREVLRTVSGACICRQCERDGFAVARQRLTFLPQRRTLTVPSVINGARTTGDGRPEPFVDMCAFPSLHLRPVSLMRARQEVVLNCPVLTFSFLSVGSHPCTQEQIPLQGLWHTL